MSADSRGLLDFDLPLGQLKTYRPERVEPPDFDAFWERTLREAADHRLDTEITPVDTPLTNLEASDVRYRGYGGDPIHGWLLRDPRDGGGTCVVHFNGYGGGRGNPLDHVVWPSLGYTTLVVETRGQGASAFGGITVDPHLSHPHVPGWLTQGIRTPETYYYRRVFVDAARAIEVARTHPAIGADQVVVVGTSQGGWIGLAAAALTDVDALVANVPFGCHFERATRITDERPYSEVAAYLRVYRLEHESVLRTLSYFDGVNFAARATAPALLSLGLMDRVCPPSTIFAAHHHYAGPCELRVWPFNGHEGGETDQLLETIEFLGRTPAVDGPSPQSATAAAKPEGFVKAVTGPGP
jgi:cephalosporin-C deacetylase